MGQYHEDAPVMQVMQAPKIDQSLTDRVNRLQSELMDLRNILEPFLTPSDDCEREAMDKSAGSDLEKWIETLVDASDVSLNVLQDIRARLYVPSMFSPSPQPDRKAL